MKYFSRLRIIFFSGVCSPENIADPTIVSICKRKGREVACSGQILFETVATITCKPNHQASPGFVTSTKCLNFGLWTRTVHSCLLIPINTQKTTETPNTVLDFFSRIVIWFQFQF